MTQYMLFCTAPDCLYFWAVITTAQGLVISMMRLITSALRPDLLCSEYKEHQYILKHRQFCETKTVVAAKQQCPVAVRNSCSHYVVV